jgi:hypothetical protein
MTLAVKPQRQHWHIQDLIVVERDKPRLLSDKLATDEVFVTD